MNHQNIVVKGKDNPVVIKFTFEGEFEEQGLNNFTRIELLLGGETYDSTDSPDKIWIENAGELRINIGVATKLECGWYSPTITGYSAAYDDGYELVGAAYQIQEVSQFHVVE